MHHMSLLSLAYFETIIQKRVTWKQSREKYFIPISIVWITFRAMLTKESKSLPAQNITQFHQYQRVHIKMTLALLSTRLDFLSPSCFSSQHLPSASCFSPTITFCTHDVKRIMWFVFSSAIFYSQLRNYLAATYLVHRASLSHISCTFSSSPHSSDWM